ncbi:MAG: hypothetical protein ABIG11_02525 [bacterium]
MKNLKFSPGFIRLSGTAALVFLWFCGTYVSRREALLKQELCRLEALSSSFRVGLEELNSTRELRYKNVRNYRKTVAAIAKSSSKVFAEGFSLQEEKRLLEKVLEIVDTSLEMDLDSGKIHLMRRKLAVKEYPMQNPGLKPSGKKAGSMPVSCRIISKERFAQPERGKVEETEGKIVWKPPQAGTSPRSAGLGEYVIFTDSPLIFHAPASNAALHDTYPHFCAGLTLYSARRLYKSSFIGNRIVFKQTKPVAPSVRKSKTVKKKKKN